MLKPVSVTCDGNVSAVAGRKKPKDVTLNGQRLPACR